MKLTFPNYQVAATHSPEHIVEADLDQSTGRLAGEFFDGAEFCCRSSADFQSGF